MADSRSESFVRFIVVPFLPPHQPALGVSSLLSVLRENDIEGDVRYLNLEYGERAGWDLYKCVTNQIPTTHLAAEMIFSGALWGKSSARFDEYQERVRAWFESRASQRGAGWKSVLSLLETWSAQMCEAFEEAPQIVADWADQVLDGSPRVLGFTTSFQQSAAALALAKEVRRRVPPEEVAILFGGANCEDDMGRAMAENFDFIDCVVSGEAEAVIVDVVRKITGDSEESLPRFVPGVMVHDMDELPIPDFDDYFAAATESEYAEVEVRLAAESSRGCWWGVKSHCTFCGLNGGTMAFRKKSPERFASELASLSQRYESNRFALTDNILDISYLRTLLPNLVAEGHRYKLFYETKSNLRKDQVELLAAAGVYMLQPGIESFSTSILKLMAKGTTRLQNIQLLKWCGELGVAVIWNLLYGFPGEDPKEYEEMAELLPSLFHLGAPMGSGKVRLDRFGPYWKTPEEYGVSDVRHAWGYDFVFSGLPESERARLAYFFDYEYEDGRNPKDYALSVIRLVEEWTKAAREGGMSLTLRDSAEGPFVFDTRSCRTEEQYSLTPAGLALVRVLDGLTRRDKVADAVREQGVEIGDAELEALLEEFAARRFIVEENGCLLSLIMDPRQRERVAERKVTLRLDRLGFRWPDDFPDPNQQKLVRAAMLAMGPGSAAESGGSASAS